MSWNDSANRPAPYPVPVPQQHPPQRRQRYSRLQPQLRALSPNRQQDATPRPSARQRHSHSSNPSFPTHNSPRTWLLTASLSPLAVRLIRQLLAHGDCVVACFPPVEIEHEERGAEFRELIGECSSERKDREGWKDRIRGIRCDGRTMSGCGAAVDEAVDVFGRIDILLCCRSEVVIGTVEEMSTNLATQSLAREQFETLFFSQVNFIKAALPQLRTQHTGHIIVLTSTGGHIGTPHMSMYTAATWALEGFCDSLTYEVAPFNIKVTIVQPNMEIQSLTNRITFAPQIPAYASSFAEAPSVREMLTNVLNSNPDTAVPAHPDTDMSATSPDSVSTQPGEAVGEIFHRYPNLPPSSIDMLVNETIHALTAIGGQENPPSRHIVGTEGAVAVKEKLKTVAEEMEDFVEASLAVDIVETELTEEARDDRNRDTSQTSAASQAPATGASTAFNPT